MLWSEVGFGFVRRFVSNTSPAPARATPEFSRQGSIKFVWNIELFWRSTGFRDNASALEFTLPVLDAYAMGRSFPIGPWLNTAPTAKLEASVVTTKGCEKFGNCRRGSAQIRSRRVSKAVWALPSHTR
ncbi:uncharacterized protein LOC143358812 [Halictus rubicundus]|uniref:uncharacterized protein LOC143358812 n=1 Tax=Halictus rubicundus TaxID=77578 RepID=UPI00403667C8